MKLFFSLVLIREVKNIKQVKILLTCQKYHDDVVRFQQLASFASGKYIFVRLVSHRVVFGEVLVSHRVVFGEVLVSHRVVFGEVLARTKVAGRVSVSVEKGKIQSGFEPGSLCLPALPLDQSG